ncbi:hypothetical protein LCI18_005394 [Fusarium solani-melongenae]|uniref:Uncharacterized protein n=1 Tax=Fusarium solani subsp. cucurbitae TaxID=2747967 RepID=A0ACD3YZN9_FUSSC|nr:hypothetical protein LCI18_005394 [Fusarium solani-melongenae]
MMSCRRQGARKRSGCTKCKEQHIRCSEELPRCGRCQRLNLECVRGLKLVFREDAIQRGIKFGREGVWTKRPGTNMRKPINRAIFQGVPLDQYANRWVFLNLGNVDFQDTDIAPCPPLQSCRSASWTPTPTSSIFHHPLHSFPDTESYLLDYFIRGISPACTLSELHNPYASLLVPLCFVSVTLRHALLAVAGNQLCLLGEDQFMEQAYRYKDLALQGIRQEISSGMHDDATVASILMLCFQEISDDCSLSWVVHLRAGLKLIDYNTTNSASDLWKFFRMYFVAHHIMSRTASEFWPEDEKSQLWPDCENLDEFDMLMGCSRGLMTLINRISILGSEKDKILKVRALTAREVEKYDNMASDIGTALLSLRQKLPKDASGRKDLKLVARVKRLAALLYLTERLGHFSPKPGSLGVRTSASFNLTTWDVEDAEPWVFTTSEPSSSVREQRENAHYNGGKSFSSDTSSDDDVDIRHDEKILLYGRSKKHLVSSMVKLISMLPDMSTLLWPLFVLGNAILENEEQRRFVLDRLASMQKMENLGSVRRTINAVRHAFTTQGLLIAGGRGWGHESYRYISLA